MHLMTVIKVKSARHTREGSGSVQGQMVWWGLVARNSWESVAEYNGTQERF